MKIILFVLVIISTIGCHQNPSFFAKHPLLTLMRKTPAEIGCMLESDLRHRDPVFNCDNKNYENLGDPCAKDVDAYYEGVQIPGNLIKKIDPTFKDVVLDFERSNLREITITFENAMLKDKIRELYKLPTKQDEYPKNVTGIDYGDRVFSKEKPADPNYTKWLVITGFDHMGAADLDCD